MNIVDTTTPLNAGFEFLYVDSTHGILATTWPGASGTFSFLQEKFDTNVNFNQQAVIWNTNVDSYATNQALKKYWPCYVDSNTQLSLFRSWDGPSSDGSHIFHLYAYATSGFQQQPFMYGVNAKSVRWGSQSPDGTNSSAYSTMLPLLGQWMASYGVDVNSPGTLGAAYEAVNELCRADAPNASTLFNTVNGATAACGAVGLASNDGAGGGEFASRVNVAESMAALQEYFLDAFNRLGPTDATTIARKTFVDQRYGGVYGNPAMTTGGAYNDANYVTAELGDGSIGSFKWPGFFFGMGMAHQWPAVRLGGVSPAITRTVYQGFVLPATGTHAIFTVTAPSSTSTQTTCTTSPCALTMDARQGDHLLTVQYLDSSNKVLATSDPTVIKVQ